MWKHAPAAYGPTKTLYNRWQRWSRMGVFDTIMTELSARAQQTEIVMIEATRTKAHRTASSLSVKKGRPRADRGRLIGRTEGGLNSKLHVVADALGRPIRMFLSAGQTSDYIGARVLLSSLPQAGALLADRGYDADWFRETLNTMEISPYIPSRIGRKINIPRDADLNRQRHNLLGHENMPCQAMDREHVRPPQGLAAYRNPIRPMPHPLSLRLRTGSNGHPLVVSPDPKSYPAQSDQASRNSQTAE